MNKKKVVYVLHGLTLGGVEVALISALPRLNLEFNLKVICLGTIDQNLISHLTPEEKATLVSISHVPIFLPFILAGVIRLILDFQPDIILCSLWRASLVGFITKKIIKKVRLLSFVHSTKQFHILDRISTFLAISSANEVLVDSKATHDYVISKFSPKKSVKIVSFHTTLPPKQKNNAPLISGSEIKFLFLGRIHEVKNIPLAIDLINYLYLRGIKVSFDIYGEDSGALSKVLGYIHKKGMENLVFFKGCVNPLDKKNIFKKYHFLIQLSSAEGMAMSVVEALQNGLVCIVTPVGEIPNYSEDMKSAIFVDTESPNGWEISLKKIVTVIDNVQLYDYISINSFESFKSVQTFTDSLIGHINFHNKN